MSTPMKQLFHTLTLCGSLLALASCAATDLVDEPGTAPELGDVTVIATLEQTTGTRTGLEEVSPTDPTQGVKVSWVSGDVIGILPSEVSDPKDAATFTFTGTTSDGQGIFKGKAEPKKGSKNNQYAIFYPANATCNGNTIDFDMTKPGQTQWGNGSMAHLGAYDVMFMTGSTSWQSFGFSASKRQAALMTFDLVNLPADLGRPQSITLGCTSTTKRFYANLWQTRQLSTLELKLSGFAAPKDNTPISIKAYLMMVPTTISKGESLTITVKGDKGSYTFTSPAMTANMSYKAAGRYTATVGATDWKKPFLGFTYTGTETKEELTGTGTSADDPFVIATAGQLRTLIETVDLVRNYSKGKFFKLASDIRIAMTANSGKWTPIGAQTSSEETAFAGTFDGDGHTISGSMTGTDQYLGFFGFLRGATIQNLTVDATVSSTNTYLGGVAGSNGKEYSYIINCINKGTVTSELGYAGGIIGYAKKVYIFGCVNQGGILPKDVEANYQGGIAGISSDCFIVGCYNTATVTVRGKCGGGIAGGSNSIMACYNTGQVKQASSSFANQTGAIAGLVMDFSNSISYCQYVLDAANTGLPFIPTGSVGTHPDNTERADLAALNGDGVAALNTGIAAWNTKNSSDVKKQCLFHFVAGTTAGPTLQAGAPQ